MNRWIGALESTLNESWQAELTNSLVKLYLLTQILHGQFMVKTPK